MWRVFDVCMNDFILARAVKHNAFVFKDLKGSD